MADSALFLRLLDKADKGAALRQAVRSVVDRSTGRLCAAAPVMIAVCENCIGRGVT